MQQPIGINKDLSQTLADMAAAVIHKCVHHLQNLEKSSMRWENTVSKKL